MAITKTARTLQASTSNAAGATTVGGTIDLRSALSLAGTARVTNGATGPTVGCTFAIEVSNDGSAWYDLFSVGVPTTALLVTTIPWCVPPEYLYARSKFTGNTVQAVTVQCDGHELTSL